MTRKNNTLFLLIPIFFLWACHTKSPEEKLREKLENDPVFYNQLKDSLEKSIELIQAMELEEGFIPDFVFNQIGEDSILQSIAVDMDKDNQREIILITTNAERKQRLSLFDEAKMKATGYFEVDEFRTSFIKSSLGKITWHMVHKSDTEVKRMELLFSYLPYKKDFYLLKASLYDVYFEEGVRSTTNHIRREIFFPLKEKKIVCSRIDKDTSEKESKTNKEKISGEFPLDNLNIEKIKSVLLSIECP